MTFANKVNRQLQATSKRQDEIEARVDQNIKNTQQNSQEIVKLQEELNRVKSALDSEREQRYDTLGEELRERELRRNNIVIHGLAEPVDNTGYNRARIEQDKIECVKVMSTMGIRMQQEDLRFCRRVGERGQDPRPVVIGLRNEGERRMILDRARQLRGTPYDNISIVPDMTKMQRRAEDKLSREAEIRNEQLTAEDREKNLRWIVVGKRGEKRLIKGSDREGINNGRRDIQLGDFMSSSYNTGSGGASGAGANRGGLQYTGGRGGNSYSGGGRATNNGNNSNQYNLGARQKDTYQTRAVNTTALRPSLLGPVQTSNANYTPIQHRRNVNSNMRYSPQHNSPQYSNRHNNGPRYNNQQYNNSQYNGSQYNGTQYNGPQYNGP
jgi:hypothetical protein